jgi:hypothetical protein
MDGYPRFLRPRQHTDVAAAECRCLSDAYLLAGRIDDARTALQEGVTMNEEALKRSGLPEQIRQDVAGARLTLTPYHPLEYEPSALSTPLRLSYYGSSLTSGRGIHSSAGGHVRGDGGAGAAGAELGGGGAGAAARREALWHAGGRAALPGRHAQPRGLHIPGEWSPQGACPWPLRDRERESAAALRQLVASRSTAGPCASRHTHRRVLARPPRNHRRSSRLRSSA